MKVFKAKDTFSLVALVCANLIPVGGVLFSGWEASTIILLYWTENLIVGFYNILKMALLPVEKPVFHLGKVFCIPFFCIHYGGFCAAHGFFLLAFFKLGEGLGPVFPDMSWPGPLIFVQLLISVIAQVWESRPDEIIWPFIALTISHGISFVQNYLLGKEYAAKTIKDMMAAPYKRIVILHVAIIVAAIFVMAFKSPFPLLVILICLKIALDISLHTKSHVSKPKRTVTVEAEKQDEKK